MRVPGSTRARVIGATAVLALIGAGGLYGWVRYQAPAVDHAVQLVPHDARAYLHVFVKPSTQQRRALRDVLERFPETDEEEEAEDFVDELISQVLSRLEMEADDAGEWIGHEAAAVVVGRDETPMAMLAVKDAARARDDLHLRMNDGRVLQVDDLMLAGSKGVLDVFGDGSSPDRSLAEDDTYRAFEAQVEDHRLVFLFLNGYGAALEVPVIGRLPQPAAIALSVRPEGALLDVVTEQDETPLELEGYATASSEGIEANMTIRGLDRRVMAGLVGLTSAVPIVDMEEDGENLEIATDNASTPSEGVAELDDAALGSEALDGFEQTFVADLSAMPPLYRSVLVPQLDDLFRPVARQLVALRVGERVAGDVAVTRIYLGFADAGS